jgi:hypothetical protein
VLAATLTRPLGLMPWRSRKAAARVSATISVLAGPAAAHPIGEGSNSDSWRRRRGAWARGSGVSSHGEAARTRDTAEPSTRDMEAARIGRRVMRKREGRAVALTGRGNQAKTGSRQKGGGRIGMVFGAPRWRRER